jgi:hypothetical protein
MKKYIILFLLVFTSLHSQNNEVKLDINPDNGCQLRYEFYPNYDAYYDIKEQVYLILKEGIWTKQEYIKPNYRGYSVYNRTFYIIKDYDGDDITKLYPIHKKFFPYVTKKTLLKEW